MRVLLLTDSDAFAGTEQHMLTLSVGLKRAGHEVCVGSPSGSPLADRCGVLGIDTMDVAKIGFIDFIAASKCIRHIHKKSIDLLHVHNSRTAIIAAIVKVFLPGIKVVLTQHFIKPTHVGRRGLERLLSYVVHRFIAGKLDKIICVSETTMTAMIQRGGAYSRCSKTVVYNGIDFDQHKPQCTNAIINLKNELRIPLDSKVVLMASRLEHEKAVDVGITAISELIAIGIPIILVIAGQGSQMNYLKQLATGFGIDDAVRFLGFRTDIPLLMAAADVFLFTSPVDSFGMSILEAMISGTPVVAANAGGPAEIVSDLSTGFLFTEGDPADLRQKLLDCVACPYLDLLLTTARKSVETKFSVGVMATQTIEVYDSLRTRAQH